MKELKQAKSEIGNVINVISSIVAQTNFLSIQFFDRNIDGWIAVVARGYLNEGEAFQ